MSFQDVESLLLDFNEAMQLRNGYEMYDLESRSNNILKLLLNKLDNNRNIIDIQNYIVALVESSIFISSFPRRLIKKGTNSQPGTQFEATICNVLTDSKIKIKILSVKSFLVNPMADGSCHRVKIEFKFDPLKPNMWNIKNMRYKSTESKRSSKKHNSEKSYIHFIISLEIKICELKTNVDKNLYSDTVVIIVHTNQETDAQLTLFIDDYFRTDRLSFVEGRGFPLMPSTNAEELINCISDYFFKETKRALTSNNCQYLLNKANSMFLIGNIAINDFIKLSMPQTKLSFGQWIIMIIRLCKNEHIQELWKSGFIEGFVSKDVDHLLLEPGCFLLRFSERQAAIGVVMMSESNEICAWAPFTEAECRKVNLANHLCDFQSLLHIRCSDGSFVPKLEVLSDFVDVKKVDDGYTVRGSSCPQRNVEGTISSENTPNGNNYDSMEDDDDFLDYAENVCDHLLNVETL